MSYVEKMEIREEELTEESLKSGQHLQISELHRLTHGPTMQWTHITALVVSLIHIAVIVDLILVLPSLSEYFFFHFLSRYCKQRHINSTTNGERFRTRQYKTVS